MCLVKSVHAIKPHTKYIHIVCACTRLKHVVTSVYLVNSASHNPNNSSEPDNEQAAAQHIHQFAAANVARPSKAIMDLSTAFTFICLMVNALLGTCLASSLSSNGAGIAIDNKHPHSAQNQQQQQQQKSGRGRGSMWWYVCVELLPLLAASACLGLGFEFE